MIRVLSCLVALCLIVVVNSSAEATDVYIVLGQSNGWRVSSLANIPNGTDTGNVVYFPMGCTTTPETADLQLVSSVHPSSQGRGLAEGLLKHSCGDIIFVQYCVCGASLHGKDSWYPGENPKAGRLNEGGLFAKFLKYTADARRKAEAAGHEWNLRAVFWHQGESDSNAHAADYQDTFRNFVYRIRNDVKPNIPIVAGHIRELSDGARRVNRALDAVAGDDPLIVVVPTADLTPENPTDAHFNSAGCHELGRRMAKAYSDLANESPPP